MSGNTILFLSIFRHSMKQGPFSLIYSVSIVLTGAMFPVCAQMPPDVHVCGSEPATFEQSHYSAGRPERHQRTRPGQLDGGNGSDGVTVAGLEHANILALCKASMEKSDEVQSVLKKIARQTSQKTANDCLTALLPHLLDRSKTSKTVCRFRNDPIGSKKVMELLLLPELVDRKLLQSLCAKLELISDQVTRAYRGYIARLRQENTEKSDYRYKLLVLAGTAAVDELDKELKTHALIESAVRCAKCKGEGESTKEIQPADEESISDSDAESDQIFELYKAWFNKSKTAQFHLKRLVGHHWKGNEDEFLWGIMGCVVYNPHLQKAPALDPKNIRIDLKNKRLHVDQASALKSYKILNDSAHRVAENYRDYKNNIYRLERCRENNEQLQKMLQEANSYATASKQSELERVIEKSKQDEQRLVSEILEYRQSLVDLAGLDAFESVDKQAKNSVRPEVK